MHLACSLVDFSAPGGTLDLPSAEWAIYYLYCKFRACCAYLAHTLCMYCTILNLQYTVPAPVHNWASLCFGRGRSGTIKLGSFTVRDQGTCEFSTSLIATDLLSGRADRESALTPHCLLKQQ